MRRIGFIDFQLVYKKTRLILIEKQHVTVTSIEP